MKTTANLLIALGMGMGAPAVLAQSSSPGYDMTTSGSSNGTEAEVGMEMRQEAMSMAALEPKIQGDVTYLCGGIGSQEAAYLKQQAAGYDLMLTFATRNGDYLADVDVNIRNAQGDAVLSANCDGPIMLVDLPRSGRYEVQADAAGHSLNRTVRVNARQGSQVAAVVMSWPQQVAEAEGTATTSSGGSEARGTSQSGQR